MNFLERKLIQEEIQIMLTKLADSVNGSKTYILAVVGIIIALVGHFYGPLQIAGTTIPAESWGDVWKVIYASGLIGSFRHAISKNAPATTVTVTSSSSDSGSVSITAPVAK